MDLRVVVAAPFRQRGCDRLSKSEFVVALSLDRDWFSPDQAERVVEVALEDGLLAEDDGSLRPTFDTNDVTVPTNFDPDETFLQRASPFEQMLEAIVAAGFDKRTAVADVNRLQADLSITIEAAAALYARRNGVDVERATEEARVELQD